MTKLKRYIIKKLGGYVIEDFDVDLRSKILKRACEKTIDKEMHEIFNNSF